MLTWIFSPFCSPLKKLKWVKHIGQGGTIKWVKWHCRQSSRPKSTWDGGWCRPTILLQPTAVYQPPAVFTPLCTSAPHTQPTYFSACPHLKEVQPGLFLCLSKFTKLCNCTHNLTLYSSVSATAAKACSSGLDGNGHIDKMYEYHHTL